MEAARPNTAGVGSASGGDESKIDAIRKPKAMTVLVNTSELSPEAAAEVEAIVAKREKVRKAKLRAMRGERGRAGTPTPPGTGDPGKFRRSDKKVIADGTSSGPLPHDMPVVSG